MVSVSHFSFSSFSLVIHSVRMSSLRLTIVGMPKLFCRFFWRPINKVWFDESVPLASVSHNSKELFLCRKTGIYFLPKATFSLSKINVTYCHWQCPPFLSWLFKNPLSTTMMHGKHVATCLWLTEFSTCTLHCNIWIAYCLQNHFFQIFNSYSSNCISLAFVFFNFSLWLRVHVF